MRGIVFIMLFCIVFEFELTEENKTKTEPDSLEKLAADIQNEKSLKGKRFNQFHKKSVLPLEEETIHTSATKTNLDSC